MTSPSIYVGSAGVVSLGVVGSLVCVSDALGTVSDVVVMIVVDSVIVSVVVDVVVVAFVVEAAVVVMVCSASVTEPALTAAVCEIRHLQIA